jgi:glycosyltransferase involved in cell wall biosynthesis
MAFDEAYEVDQGIPSWRGRKVIMKRWLEIIRKIFLALFWALRFKIFRLVDFVHIYQVIERSGLFDAVFYRETLALADRNRMDPYPLVHYLARGARDGKDPHPLFDTTYYLKRYPDVVASDFNPLVHYLKCGANEDRNPSPLFDTAYYLKQYPDVSASGLNPLIHYLEYGACEDRNPNPLFDTAYYLKQYPDVSASGLNPLVHYLEYGAHEDRNPNPLFDTAHYLKQYPDVLASGLNPLVHYLEFGAHEARKPNSLFDTAYYLKQYPDVLESGLNPLAHYLEFGAHEARKPNSLFDTAYYLKEYPDVSESGLNPLAHYLKLGADEDRKPNPLFDTAYYLRQYPDVLESGLNPLARFFECGVSQDQKPHPLFDTAYYSRQYPDVLQSGLNPLAHYLEFGAYEDRNPNPLFDSAYYLNKYKDVREAGVNPLIDYLENGVRNDRNPHPLFDTGYYWKNYPDVVTIGMNPLTHYLEYGALDGRKPHPLFDTAYYLLRIPELKTTGVNPLVHFLNEGSSRGIKPHPLFYPIFYLEKYPDIAATGMNPLVHFVENGGQVGRDPNPMFNTLYYLRQNPDVAASGCNVLVHYLETGAREGRDPHPFFRTSYYAKVNYDVIDAGTNPLAHYVEYGINEGRSPYDIFGPWVKSKRLTPMDIEKIKRQIDQMAYHPVFSVIVPVYNTDEQWLRRCLDSVLLQLYPHWELCIADDASTVPHVRDVLTEYAARDSRIRVIYLKENGHISATSNAALALARGEFIALLDHDDEISIDALYENAILLNARPDADMIYSDEDKITEDGIRHMPFFKPDWSPDTFLSQMYSGHLGVYRTEIIRKIGGFRIGFEGSQDYDLVLRFTENTSHIYHIPKILYHWRTIQGSTARMTGSKNYAYVAAKKAIQEALDRRGEGGQVDFDSDRNGHYRVRYPIRGNPLVSIIIPTRDNGTSLGKCLASIFEKTTYRSFEVLIVDNGSVQQETKKLFDRWKTLEGDRFHVVSADIPFNYSRLNNEGVRHARGDILVLLNDDIEVISVNWLEEMAGQAQRETIGAVGAVLLYPDDTIQHAGVILGVGGGVTHSYKYATASSPGYFGRLLISANYAAVTGACLMVTKERYLNIGGLDEELAVAYNDVDFCLRLLQKGYRNIVLSRVRLYHRESRSWDIDVMVDRNKDRLKQEMTVIETRWRDFIVNDPYYNPNLTKTREDFSLPIKDRSLDIRLKLQRELLRDPFMKARYMEQPPK